MEKVLPKLRFPEFKENWGKKKINEIAEKINSGKTPLGGETVYTENGVTFIRSQNINDDKLLLDNVVYIPEEINKGMKNSVVKPNDILLNITGASLGRSCVVPENFTTGNVNQHVCIVRLNEKNNSNFIQSFFSSFKGQIIFQSLQTGSGREGLNFESIKGIKINLPSLPEQQKIASFLTSVDERLTLLAQQKEKLELYKKGVMRQIFSQKLRFKDENGNNYPDWEEKKLENIATYRRGSFPQPYGLPKWYDDLNGTPFVQVYDVDDNFRLKNTTKQKISDLAKPQSVFVKKGSIIITIQGSIGRIAITQYDSYVDRTLLIFQKFNYEIDKVFFVYSLFLLFEYEKTIAVGGTIKTITKEKINDFEINLPCLEEQQKIASFLSAIDVQIEGASKKIAQTKLFKKGLLQQMFV